eukprot:4261003-Pleurochrysis_carterae.AAC.3
MLGSRIVVESQSSRAGEQSRFVAVVAECFKCVRRCEDHDAVAPFIAQASSRYCRRHHAQVSENEEVRYYVHKITTQLRADTRECARLAEPFAAHSALWTEAMDEELRRFLNSADHAPAAPTVPYAAARTRMRSQPSLAEFEARISKYKKLQDAISSMPVAATVGWIKLDSKPIKQARRPLLFALGHVFLVEAVPLV